MSNIISADNGSFTGTAGFKLSSDTSGALAFQTGNNVTALTVDSSQNLSLVGGLTVSGSVTHSAGTANGVAYLNGSKVLTTGSALTFDGTDFTVSGGNARINKSSNASILTLGGSPSNNWEGDIQFLTSNAVTNWRLASNRLVSGAFTITPSTAGGGSTFTTPAVTIDSSGNVGIGTSSPSSRLSFGANIGRDFAVYEGAGGANKYGIGMGGAGTGGDPYRTKLYANGTEYLCIDSNGNVGIGTSSPTTYGGFSSIALNNTTGGLLDFSAAGTVQGQVFSSATEMRFTKVGANFMAFYTNAAERMRIDSSGNVGIGTVPSNRLDVTAALGVVNVSSSTGTNYVKLQVNNTGGSFQFAIENSAGSNFGAPAYSRVLWNDGAYPTVFFVNATQRMTLFPSGNFGVGNTGDAYKFTVYGSTPDIVTFHNGANGTRGYITSDNSAVYLGTTYSGGGVPIIFAQGGLGSSGAERARIDSSGNLLVGTTNSAGFSTATGAQTTPSGRFLATCSGDTAFAGSRLGSDGNVASWYRNTALVGSISVTASATAYNTSSDYRLKDDIAPMNNALSKVAALKPVTYKWKSTGEFSQGFIAHELQTVVPECVSGEKDAVDAEGKPQYQGIDTSFLVATLTAAIQEQQALIESLTTRLTALEQA